MALVLRGKDALHDHLVCTPVPDTQNRRAKENTGPGKLAVRRRLHHVEIVSGYRGTQPGKTTDFVQTDDGQRNRTGEQDQGLHQIGVNHRGQSARDGIDTRRHNQNDGRSQWAPSHHTLQNNRRGIEMHGDFRKDVSDHGNRCKVSGAIAVEAAFQELGHGENIRTKVERHENPAEQEQHQAGQPFKMAYGQPRRGAGTRQADEMFRGNVRYKE